MWDRTTKSPVLSNYLKNAVSIWSSFRKLKLWFGQEFSLMLECFFIDGLHPPHELIVLYETTLKFHLTLWHATFVVKNVFVFSPFFLLSLKAAHVLDILQDFLADICLFETGDISFNICWPWHHLYYLRFYFKGHLSSKDREHKWHIFIQCEVYFRMTWYSWWAMYSYSHQGLTNLSLHEYK